MEWGGRNSHATQGMFPFTILIQLLLLLFAFCFFLLYFLSFSPLIIAHHMNHRNFLYIYMHVLSSKLPQVISMSSSSSLAGGVET